MKEFCPRCGKEKGPFVKGFCIECFGQKNELVLAPKEIEIEKCKQCQKVKLRGLWSECSEKSLKEFVESKVKTKDLLNAKKEVKLSFLENGGVIAKVEVRGEVDFRQLVFEHEIFLKLKTTSCTTCSKVFGNYFEAIIQLRSEKSNLALTEKKVLKAQKLFEQMQKKDSLAQIVKISKEKNGVDLFVGSNRAAKQVVSILEKTAKQRAVVSTTLHGFDKKKGKKVFRYTYCLRF